MNTKVLYIAGYGRSGSTVLDIILGNHSEIVSTGELAYLPDEWLDSDRRCACSRKYEKCEFWRGLPNVIDLSDESRNVIRRVERRGRTLDTLFRHHSNDKITTRYKSWNQKLFSYIKERSGKSIIVDSSKSARDTALRFYALSEIADLDVHVVHLVRDGCATVDSHVKKGSNWAIEGYQHPPRLPGFRSSIGWTLANALTLWLAKNYFPSSRYIRINFSDLISQPGTVLRQIGRMIKVDLSNLVKDVEDGLSFDVGHNVGGNRLRRNSQVKLKTKSGYKTANKLSWYHRAFFNATGGWLQYYMRQTSN